MFNSTKKPILLSCIVILMCFINISAFGQFSDSYVTYNYGAYSPKGSSGAYYENVSFQYRVQPYNISSDRQQEYDRVAIIVKPSPTKVFKFKYNGMIYDIADVCSDIFHHTGGSGFDMFGKFTMSISVYGAGTKNLTFDGSSGGNDEVIIPLNRIYKQGEYDQIKVTSIKLIDIQPLQASIDQIKRCLDRKEKKKKTEQEQKLAEQKAKKETEEREKEQQRSSSNNYSNNNSTNSSYSSTNNRSSGQTQRNPYDDFRNGMNKMNNSINKIDQAQQNFHNQIDQQFAPYRAQMEADNAKWEQEKLQKQLDDKQKEQERIEKERRKAEAEADYNRRYSAELSRKRDIIRTRERLLDGNEWGLSPTFSLIAKNQEPLYLFFIEVEGGYRDLNDHSSYSYGNPRIIISISNNPGIVISPIIEIKPRNNGEYPFPEDIASKLKKDYPSEYSHSHLYRFHNWTMDREEVEQAYNSFLNSAKNTDFSVEILENKKALQDENSEYWGKGAETTKESTIQYWDKNTDKKTTTQSKDYWGEPVKKPAKEESTKPDYWK